MVFSQSLKKNEDFRKVYENGVSLADSFLVMYKLPNNSNENRLGISVSKKVGNSIVRHHLTRLIREAYRLHEEMFDTGLDIVIVARSRAKSSSYKTIEKSLLKLADLHQILK
ncbi:ribonuclease P protein component [Sharpea azabuensis]|uniref:ribonuclease P protein component n=1 Tax=Sharpea azabuensis TaxID=322505 RepID=UPI00156A6CE8|nr:ribonuclease P protein component [Sharpea azabuensis]